MIAARDSDLPGIARDLGAIVKPLAFVAATLITRSPQAVWSGSLDEALTIIEPRVSPDRAFNRFFSDVRDWPPTPERARRMIASASEAIDDAAAWYVTQEWPAVDLDGVSDLQSW